MASDWQEVPIGSLCEGIYDGPHATPTRTDVGPIFLGISSLVKGRLDLSQSDHLSEEDFPSWTRRVIPTKDDLVFSYETRLGEAALIPEGLRCCLGRRMALMRLNRKKADPRFVLYAFLSPQFQDVIRSRTKQGSTVTRILLTEIGDFPIALPPIDEQRAIGEMMGVLDDRVDLLTGSNRTCEGIARAIFKSWFVDFDPVRAKAEGREPEGMDAATAALFPSEFRDSDFGPIPEGWRYHPVKDLLVSAIGGDWGKEKPDENHSEMVAIIRGTDMPTIRDGSITGIPIRYTSRKKLDARALMDGDIVIEVSGGSPTQPTGRSIFVTDATLAQFNTSVVPASFCRLFRPSQKHIGLVLAQHLSHIYAEGKMWGYQNQSTGISNFQTKHFLDVEKVCIPSAAVLSAFQDIVRPLVDRQQLKASQTLADLRDTLLPRLISGKLRVPEAEKVVEAVL